MILFVWFPASIVNIRQRAGNPDYDSIQTQKMFDLVVCNLEEKSQTIASPGPVWSVGHCCKQNLLSIS